MKDNPIKDCEKCLKRYIGITTGFVCFTPMYSIGINAKEDHLIATPIINEGPLNNKGSIGLPREGRPEKGLICAQYAKQTLTKSVLY